MIETSVTSVGARIFGVANSLTLDTITANIEKGKKAVPVLPTAVTIAELLESDSLASRVVTISDFTFDTVVEVVQDITVESYYLYQDGDSIPVDSSFIAIKDSSSVNVIYYLNGFYTRLLPYCGKIGEVSSDNGDPDDPEEPENPEDAIDNVLCDNSLFISNGVLYASNAEIEVYDVMGRRVAFGVNSVSVENVNQMVFIVRTKYLDGQVFVTKVTNR